MQTLLKKKPLILFIVVMSPRGHDPPAKETP